MANEIKIKTSIDTKNTNSQLATLENRIFKTTNKLEEMRRKKEEMDNTPLKTQDLIEIEKQIQKDETAMARLDDRMRKFVETGGKQGSKTFQNMRYDAAELENSIAYAKTEKEELIAGGAGYYSQAETAQYKKLTNQIQAAENELGTLTQKHKQLVAQSSGLNKLNGMFDKMGKRISKLALRLFFFSQITKLFRSMISGMAEGFKNLAQYSSEYNESVSRLKSAQAELKNNLASAFAPIVQMIIPALVTLCGWLSRAAELISMFFAALSGKSTFTKATKQAVNYAKGLDKAGKSAKKTKGELADFDDLHILNKNNDNGSGGGGSGELTGANAFEEAKISDDFLEKVKLVKSILEAILPLVILIGAALLAWKVFSFVSGLMSTMGILGVVLGVIIAIAGLALAVYNYFQMWKNGVNWSNLIGYIAGVAIRVGALIALFGPIVGGIDLIVGAAAGLILALKDIIENGFTTQNVCLLVVSAIGLIIGVFMVFGAPAALVVAAIMAIIAIITALINYSGNGAEVLGHLKNAFKKLGDFISKIFAGDVKGAFKDLKEAGKEFVNFFLSAVEGLANGVLKCVNLIIDAINSVNFGPIPDWVPIIGGKTFNLNIPKFSGSFKLPRLANGGITTGSTLANIGEAGREAVLPLENNTGWMNDFADRLLDRMGGNMTAVLELNGRELGRAVYPLMQSEGARIGTVLSTN